MFQQTMYSLRLWARVLLSRAAMVLGEEFVKTRLRTMIANKKIKKNVLSMCAFSHIRMSLTQTDFRNHFMELLRLVRWRALHAAGLGGH